MMCLVILDYNTTGFPGRRARTAETPLPSLLITGLDIPSEMTHILSHSAIIAHGYSALSYLCKQYTDKPNPTGFGSTSS